MSEHKPTFTDTEILFYGQEQGFPYQEGLSPLAGAGSPEMQDGLLKMASEYPSLKTIADYVASSFMNPKRAFSVFGELEGNFLRFRAALPDADIFLPAYALLISAGSAGSYLGCENQETVYHMLMEFSGLDNISDITPDRTQEAAAVSLIFRPVDMLVILAACDVIIQNRYEGGWFTVASLLNVFDLTGDSDFSRVCSPLAAVAKEAIFHSVTIQDVERVLQTMTDDDILREDEIDGKKLYSFSMKYRSLPKIFTHAQNRLAVFKYDENGSAVLVYIHSNDTGTWGLIWQNGQAMIKKLDKAGLQELCQSLLM